MLIPLLALAQQDGPNKDLCIVYAEMQRCSTHQSFMALSCPRVCDGTVPTAGVVPYQIALHDSDALRPAGTPWHGAFLLGSYALDKRRVGERPVWRHRALGHYFAFSLGRWHAQPLADLDSPRAWLVVNSSLPLPLKYLTSAGEGEAVWWENLEGEWVPP